MRRAGHRLDAGWTYATASSAIARRQARPRGAESARTHVRPRARTRTSPWPRVVAYVAAWLAFCGVVVAAADAWALTHQQDVALRQAQADLRDSLQTAQEGLGKDGAPIIRAQIAAVQAKAEVTAAHHRLDDDWLVRSLGWLPPVSHQLVAIRKLEDAIVRAADLSLRGEVLLGQFQAARQAPGHGPAVDTAGRLYIARQQEIESLATDALALPSLLEGVDRGSLVPPLRAAYARLDTPMRQLRDAAPDVHATLAAAPGLLGKDHPVHYLLLFADNTELRPGGGYIGSYGILGFDHGAYTKPAIQPLKKLEKPLVPLRAYRVGGIHYLPPWLPLQRAFPNATQGGTQLLSNVDTSAQWPDDARMAEQLYASESGQAVDGVVQVDITALADILRVTGPVDVAAPGKPPQRVDEGNVAQLLVDNTREPTKQYLGVVEQALNDRLEGLPPAQLPGLLRALQQASEERHVMVYVNTAPAQALIAAHQLDRPVPGPSGDAVMPVFANLAGDKADLFTSRGMRVAIDAAGNHTITLGLTNRSPGNPTSIFSQYRELVQFYLPPDATDVSATGFLGRNALYPGFSPGPLDRGADLGWRVYGGWVLVLSGQDATITLSYRRAALVGPFAFTVVQQPGGVPWAFALNLTAPGWVPQGSGTIANGVLHWQTFVTRDTTFTAARNAAPAAGSTP